MHINSEIEFRVIFGPREGLTARGADAGGEDPGGGPSCPVGWWWKKKNQVARCERGVGALRCASVCVSLSCVSVRLPVERRGMISDEGREL